jgi:EmrB/QacA subfamily drug resistance transporter
VNTVGATADAPSRPATTHPSVALVVIAGAQLMVVLDAAIVNIALPNIHRALGFSLPGLAWVLNAYTLVFGGLLLLGGRTGDLFGRRRMFVIGVSLFAAASLVGGFAQGKGLLLAMRALQGVGGAIASPTALSLVATTFPAGPARNRAFGVYAAVSGAGAAVGLILGGVLVDLLSWRWVFFVNAPIGLVLAIAAPYAIAESRQRNDVRLDIPGALASTGGMAALVYGLIHAATYGWGSEATVVSLLVAVVLLTAFVAIETFTTNPLMPMRLFRDRARVGSYVVMLVMGAGVFGMFYFLTQYVQNVKGFTPLEAGLCFLPISAVIIVMAQVASRALAKLGAQALIVSGTIAVGFGMVVLSSLTPGSSYPLHILPGIMLIGMGMGFIFVPVTVTAVAGVAAADAGIASAMLNVGQQVGGTIGLAALVTVFGTAVRHDAGSHAGTLGGSALADHAFTHGADMAFRAGAFFALVGLACAWLLIKVRPAST